MIKGLKKWAVLALAAVLLIPLVGCAGSSSTPTTPTATIPDQIATLTSRVNALDSRVSAISAPDISGQLSPLQSQLRDMQSQMNSLQSQLSDVSTRLDALNTTTGTNVTPGKTTTWTAEAWADYAGYKLVDVYASHSKIEEEGDYIIYLDLYNNNVKSYGSGARPVNASVYYNLTYTTATIGVLWLDTDLDIMLKCTAIDSVTGDITWVPAKPKDVYSTVAINSVVLDFRPKSSGVVVDANNTYLDDYTGPYYGWEVTVISRSDDTCRRIEAVSGKFTLPIPDSFTISSAGELNPIPFELKLDFELYYA